MTIVINVNGCVFCGELEREHCQRYDGLHPRGRNGYTPPTNDLRLARLLLNIFNRRYPYLSTMRSGK